MLAPIAALAIVPVVAPPQEGAPSTETEIAAAVPEDLRWVLDEVATLRAEGELETARGLLSEVVDGELRSRLREEEHDVVRAGLAALEEAAGSLGLLEVRRDVREELHELLAARLPAEHPERLRAATYVADSRRELGDLAGALALYEEVRAAFRRSVSAEHPDLLVVELHLGLTRYELGHLDEALELFEHVHATWDRLLPADHLHLLGVEMNLAATRQRVGDVEGAVELLEHVHAAYERLLPAGHVDLIRAKGNLAIARERQGDLEGALELYEHVHAAFEGLLPPDHPDLLAARSNLASVRQLLGDFEGAHELHERVLAALERLLPEDHPRRLGATLNLATVRQLLGDLDGAIELLERVHAAQERLLSADHPDLLGVEVDLAAARFELGDLDGALELFEHVHAALGRSLPEAHPERLLAAQNLASARRETGDLAGALELEERVHAELERLVPRDHPQLLGVRTNLAVTRRALGDRAGALALARSVLEGQRDVASRLRTESPRVARSAALLELARLARVLSIDPSQAPDPGDASAAPLEPLLFAVLEGLRHVSTSSTEVAVAVSRRPELAADQARLGRLRGELNDLGLSPPATASELEGWRARLFELAEERDELEHRLRSALEEDGALAEPPTAERVAAGLEPRGAYVGYFRYPRFRERDLETGARPPPVDSLLAFVLAPDASVRSVDLGPAAELERLALRWRASVGSPLEARGDPPVGAAAGADEVAVGRELRARLLDPCLAALGGEAPRVLHVVLDDFLHSLPLEALPRDDGRRVGESLALRLEVSTQRLLHPAPPVSRPGTLVALGGVDYDAPAATAPAPAPLPAAPRAAPPLARSTARTRLPALPHTRLEVRALQERFEANHAREPVVLTGAEASKRALVEHAPSARWLHLATHGWFAPEVLASTRDALGLESHALARAERTVRGFAPETLCGLALAGANSGTTSVGTVPGILTAEELSTLDLSGCELAVLSACETNVGIRRAGQGIQSLQAALHAAGARTAITSLWKVDDAAARKLMERFYNELWRDGLGKADALWRAKMALRDEGRPLRDWAGWVLTGDPD